MQSGWPTPVANVVYRNNTLGNVLVFGVTPPYQLVQDYKFAAGQPLAESDLRGRQLVSVRGHPEKLEVSRSYAGLFKGM